MDTSIIEFYRTINRTNNSSKAESELNSAKNFVLSGFMDCGKYFMCTVNNVEKELLIYGSSNGLNTNLEMNFITKPSEYVLVGDIVHWDNSDWLVTKLDADDSIFCQGKIQKCTNILNVHKNGVLYKVPCVVGKTSGSFTEDTKNLSVIDGRINVKVSNNEITSLISPNDILKIGRFTYTVLKPDDITEVGLLNIPMQFYEGQQKVPVYTIKVLNNLVTDALTPIQIQVEVSNDIDGVLSPTPSLIYAISDETLGTISESGLFTPLKDGLATITVKLESDETLLTTAEINVSVRIDNFTYVITPTTDYIVTNPNLWRTFTATRYNNGVVDPTGKFTFTLDAEGCPTTKYKFEIIDDNNCRIMYTDSKTYYAMLKVVDTVTGIETNKSIKFKSSI